MASREIRVVLEKKIVRSRKAYISSNILLALQALELRATKENVKSLLDLLEKNIRCDGGRDGE